jgi:hypothetical protein
MPYCPDIDPIIGRVSANPFDKDDSLLEIDSNHQPVAVAFDVEDYPVGRYDAGRRIATAIRGRRKRSRSTRRTAFDDFGSRRKLIDQDNTCDGSRTALNGGDDMKPAVLAVRTAKIAVVTQVQSAALPAVATANAETPWDRRMWVVLAGIV